MIKILLLGTPVIFDDRDPIFISRKIPRTILYYLAVENKVVNRETLINILWPHVPLSKAKQRLRDNLSKLKRDLPKGTIISTSDQIRLVEKRVYVDVTEFEWLIYQFNKKYLHASQSGPDQLPYPACRLLEKAINLWRGNTFLEGADIISNPEIDEWLIFTNSRLSRKLFAALKLLGAHYCSIGAHDIAYAILERARLLDDHDEELAWILFNCLYAQNKYQEVIDFYEQYQARTHQFFSETPSERLAKLFNSAKRKIAPNVILPEAVWKIHTPSDTPFIGRANELARLSQYLSSKQNVIVIGESGIGKTRLVYEFVQSVKSDYDIYLTTCHPAEKHLPYQPITDLLSPIVKQFIASSEFNPTWKIPLQSIFPEISFTPDSINLTSDKLNANLKLALINNAVRHIFDFATKDREAIFIIDDLQWADKDTLALLNYIISRAPFNKRAWMVLLLRSEAQDKHLSSFVLNATKAKALHTLHLRPLNTSYIADLAAHILSDTPTEQFVHLLSKESNGNPFFIIESLQALLASKPDPDLGTINSLPLSKNLRNLFTERLDNLTDIAHQIAEVIAVIGREVTPGFLHLAIDTEKHIIDESLEELVDKKVLRASRNLRSGYRFYFIHDKFREAIYDALSPVRKSTLHLTIAQTLEQLLPDHQYAEIGYHYQEAGEEHKAYQYWTLAAYSAYQKTALVEALASFAAANTLLSTIGESISDDELSQFFNRWADAAYIANRDDILLKIAQELSDLGINRGNPWFTGFANLILTKVATIKNNYTTGIEYGNLAIKQLSQTTDWENLAEAYYRYGENLYFAKEIAHALEAYNTAIRLSKQIKDKIKRSTILAEIHYQLAAVYIVKAQPADSLQHATSSLEYATQASRPFQQAMAYNLITLSNYHLGNTSAAVEAANKGIAIASKYQIPRFASFLKGAKSLCMLFQGKLDTAYELAHEMISEGIEQGMGEIQAYGYRIIGDIHRLLQNLTKAMAYYQQSLVTGGDHFIAKGALLRLGYLQTLQDKNADGLNQLQEASQRFYETGQWFSYNLSEIHRAYALANLGRIEQSRAIIKSRENSPCFHNLPILAVYTQLFQIEFDTDPNNRELIRQQLLAVTEKADQLQNPWIKLKALQLGKKLDIWHDQQQFDHVITQITGFTTHRDLQPSLEIFLKSVHQNSIFSYKVF